MSDHDKNNRHTRLQRNGEQGIDQPAVENDDLLSKARPVRIKHDVIVVAAGGEQRGLAALHDARDHEARLRLDGAPLAGREQRRPDQMTIALRFVDVGLAQRSYAVAQHRARCGVDHAERQPALEIRRRGAAIASMLDEKTRPRLELAVVDRLSIAAVEILHLELELDVHGEADGYEFGLSFGSFMVRLRASDIGSWMLMSLGGIGRSNQRV